MNFRISFILIVLLAVVGGYVLIFELQRGEVREPDPPQFYNLEEQQIQSVIFTHLDETQAFVKRESTWYFDDAAGDAVNMDRWSGIPLLLTGPRSRRLLEEQIDDLTIYGLDPPVTLIQITLMDQRQLNVLLGDLTPDGSANYALLEGTGQGFGALFAIDVSWGDVMNRLVAEPPVPLENPPDEDRFLD